MEFTVSKADLVRELSLSQGVVEKKTTIPILSNVLLEAAGDHVTLTATDLELGIRCACPARVKTEGSGTIPARKLLDYVRLLPDADVTLKFLENHWASLTCGRSKTRMAGMSRESFPELPQLPEPVAEVPIRLLSSMISRTSFAISTEETRFTLNGALLLLKTGEVTMVATDGHRLAFVQSHPDLPEISKIFRALVPKKAMSEIVKLADESDSDSKAIIAGDDNHLFFQIGGRLLITRKLTGNFPDYDRVLPKDNQYTAKLNRDEVRSAIERVAQFADERSRAIRVQFVNGEVRIYSSSAETGESEESVPSEYEGPDLEIGFNAQYLLDFLRVTNQDQVTFELKDQKSAGEMRPPETVRPTSIVTWSCPCGYKRFYEFFSMPNEVNTSPAEVYDSSSIKVLEGLEAVRLRPAMYIGSTGEMGLHHLVYEVVDNSVDEALAGYCDRIDVTIHIDNSITVVDNGRGIPVDLHEEEGISAAEVVMTKLHAGGKFDSKSYKVSGGLHGVGVSCVNALSERLELEIWRDGYTWQQEYGCGHSKAPLARAGKAGRKTGTKLTFKPDASIMDVTVFNYDTLAQRLREMAFLNKGLTISLTDERVDPPKSHEYHYSGGIAEFITHLNRGKSVLHEKPIHFEADKELPNGMLTMEVALQYNDSYSESIFSFANNINTVDGGTHLSGFRSALTRTINAYGQQAGLFKDVKENLSGDDVREGLTAVVSIKIPQPQFEGRPRVS